MTGTLGGNEKNYPLGPESPLPNGNYSLFGQITGADHSPLNFSGRLFGIMQNIRQVTVYSVLFLFRQIYGNICEQNIRPRWNKENPVSAGHYPHLSLC